MKERKAVKLLSRRNHGGKTVFKTISIVNPVEYYQQDGSNQKKRFKSHKM